MTVVALAHRRAAVWGGLLLASLAAPAAAQPVPPEGGQAGKVDAVRVLLDQSAYWRSKSENTLADEALTRVLALDPQNAEALATQAQSLADRGDKAGAEAALTRLRSARPDDPRIPSIQQSIRLPPVDGAALADARRLSAENRPADAVAAYRRAFHGTVPPSALAVDYYQELAATDGNWDGARSGLEAAVRADPQNLKSQLVYAQTLINHEGTRADGIDRLIALSSLPAVGDAARASWRDGLLWSGNDTRTQQQLAAYTQRYPSDPQLDQRRADIAASVPNAATQARLSAYSAMQDHDLPGAEKGFLQAIADDPNDVESTVMLASIRRVQHREPEVQALLAKAREIDAERATQLIASVALDKVYPTPAASVQATGDGGAAIRRQYREVTALTARGEFAAAEQLLRRLMGSRPNTGNLLQMADLQARSGQLAEAERTYRTALQRAPRNTGAIGGLAGVLGREGKTDEARALLASAGLGGGGAGAGSSQADVLRRQAQGVSDPDQRLQLFREAVAADGANPWLRLELARELIGQGKPADAQAAMTPVLDAARPTTDQVRAGIYYAEARDDYPLVASLVQRLPPQARTPDLLQAQQRGLVDADLRDARAAGSVAGERQRMLAMVARPDPAGLRGAAFAHELVRLGDKAGAREVIRAALGGPPATPAQRIAYSGALLAAGFPGDAQAVSGPVSGNRLTPVQQGELSSVRNGAAVAASDQLNGKGEQAEAYDQLAPRLARDPQNADLNLALARLYAARNQPSRAAAISEDVLRREPGNVSARITALNAAVQGGDNGRAEQIGREMKEAFPDEPSVFVAAAGAERARGDNGQALRDLRKARALRQQQISTDASSSQPGA